MSNKRYDLKQESPLDINVEASLFQKTTFETDETTYEHSVQTQDSLKARLLYVSRAKYETDWHSTQHTHYFSELFYVIGGCGNFYVGNNSFEVKSNDLILVNPNVSHTETSLPDSALEYIVLGIDGLSFFAENGASIEYNMINFNQDHGRLFQYLDLLYQEMEQDNPYKSVICDHLLTIILTYIKRKRSLCFALTTSRKVSRECAAVKQYIDSHFKDTITLDELALVSHLNKYYLVHHFNHTYGLSPINYLLEKRIEESKYLLASTDYSMSEIAQIVGFSSSSYFSQSFKRATNHTPVSYRKMHKQTKE